MLDPRGHKIVKQKNAEGKIELSNHYYNLEEP